MYLGTDLYIDFWDKVVCLDFRAQDFTLKIEVKACAYQVKIRACEVKSYACEVKIRACEVKIRAYELNSWNALCLKNNFFQKTPHS